MRRGIPDGSRPNRLTIATVERTARSSASRRMLADIRQFATYDQVRILLVGESGTGKSQLARCIHEYSPRRTAPFQDVDLATLEDSLSASDLFGHLRGAFSGAVADRIGHFEAAHGGTLFLDEIGKASLVTQRRLLRAVETGEITPVGSNRSLRVDVRIVGATNVPLEKLVADGAFLPDLLHRFGVFTVEVPPLRERWKDIEPLMHDFVAAFAPHYGYAPGAVPSIDPELIAAAQKATWTGNIRELQTTLQYLLVRANGASELTLAHFGDAKQSILTSGVERSQLVAEHYRRTGNGAETARCFGISRDTLYADLRRAGVEPRRGRNGDARESRDSTG